MSTSRSQGINELVLIFAALVVLVLIFAVNFIVSFQAVKTVLMPVEPGAGIIQIDPQNIEKALQIIEADINQQ